MSIRQQIIRFAYPLLMSFKKKMSVKKEQVNANKTPPPVSVYSQHLRLINGQNLDLSTLRGRKLMVVNTASECGFTPQFEELEKLSQRFPGTLTIIGFPANDFKGQEPGSDEEIASFCKRNYGVTFPLASKTTVVKGKEQHPVFQWLTDATKNGWNNKPPSWNFSKYLINETGVLTHVFDPGDSPLSESVIEAIK